MLNLIVFLLPLAAYALPGHPSLLEKRYPEAPLRGSKYCAVFRNSYLTTFKHNFDPTINNYIDPDETTPKANIIGLVRTPVGTHYSLFKGQALSTIIEVNFKVYQTVPTLSEKRSITAVQKIIVYQRDAVTKAILKSIIFEIQLDPKFAVYVPAPYLSAYRFNDDFSVKSKLINGKKWLPSGDSGNTDLAYYDFVANNVTVGTFEINSAGAYGLDFAMYIDVRKFNLEKASGACTLDISGINQTVQATSQTFPTFPIVEKRV